MQNIAYQDSGSPFEDASILRNAVHFSTAQRAYSAQLVMQQALDEDSHQRILDFLVVKAFEEFMSSTEDLLGWLFALQEWQPGNNASSLFILLDRIKVGKKDKKNDYTEKKAVSLLSNIDEEGFRKLCHIPQDDKLITSGMSEELVDNIKRTTPFKLAGWLKIATRRVEQSGSWVHMFNNLKHHMLAFPTQERSRDEVWIPTSIRLNKEENKIVLERGWLEADADYSQWLISYAIVTQAVLHDTLALILITRYGDTYSVPDWVIRAYRMASI
ncbi:hypothetical protein ACFLUJ_08780 [Chloroflexota bacterium]